MNPSNNNENATPTNSDDTEILCGICLGPLNIRQIATPDCCVHEFCADCLKAWAKTNPVCPIDRKEIKEMLITEQSLNGPIIHTFPMCKMEFFGYFYNYMNAMMKRMIFSDKLEYLMNILIIQRKFLSVIETLSNSECSITTFQDLENNILSSEQIYLAIKYHIRHTATWWNVELARINEERKTFSVGIPIGLLNTTVAPITFRNYFMGWVGTEISALEYGNGFEYHLNLLKVYVDFQKFIMTRLSDPNVGLNLTDSDHNALSTDQILYFALKPIRDIYNEVVSELKKILS